MKKVNLLITALILSMGLALLFVFDKNTYAKEICYTQYGGGEECVEVEDTDLEVDKSIWNPKADEWQSNIDPEDGSNPYTFDPEETIDFKITVKNKGDVEIKDIDLVDLLPDYVKYDDGDGEGKNDDTKVVFDEFDLDPGESKTFEFSAEVADDGVLPKDDRLCLTNIAEAEGKVEIDDDEEELDDVDYANFCIELPSVKGESIEKLPTTGTFGENSLEKLILLLSMGVGLMFIGYGIKRLAD